MRLSELIEQLQYLEQELEGAQREEDPEVVVHQQPNYPLAGNLQNIRFGLKDGQLQLWLASGSASEYGRRAAWEPCETLAEAIDEDSEN